MENRAEGPTSPLGKESGRFLVMAVMIWELSGTPFAFLLTCNCWVGGKMAPAIFFLVLQICEEPKPLGYCLPPRRHQTPPHTHTPPPSPASEPGLGYLCQGCLSLCLASYLFTWASG